MVAAKDEYIWLMVNSGVASLNWAGSWRSWRNKPVGGTDGEVAATSAGRRVEWWRALAGSL